MKSLFQRKLGSATLAYAAIPLLAMAFTGCSSDDDAEAAVADTPDTTTVTDPTQTTTDPSTTVDAPVDETGTPATPDAPTVDEPELPPIPAATTPALPPLPTIEPPEPIGEVPADFMDGPPAGAIKQIDAWKITLPYEGNPGKPLTVNETDFPIFVSPPWYYQSTAGEAVFAALCACDDEALLAGRTDCGYHTLGSSYARSELREAFEWNTSIGQHIMDTSVTITHLPTTTTKRDVAVNQIHDPNEDIVLVRLRERRGTVRTEPSIPLENGDPSQFCIGGCPAPLVVEGTPIIYDELGNLVKGSAVWYGVLEPNYQEGTPFRTRIHAHRFAVDIYFAYGDEEFGPPKVRVAPANIPDSYFKAGCYNHSGMKPDKGQCLPNDYAETRFTNIDVQHTDEEIAEDPWPDIHIPQPIFEQPEETPPAPTATAAP